ncbi:MAG TPA: RcnB family protein [Caulobacteraceae bacterium]|jgi:Ni/Co efflux regulator RcnB|nr:RcnB family protein [Caulobacteraceae bacterium]
MKPLALAIAVLSAAVVLEPATATAQTDAQAGYIRQFAWVHPDAYGYGAYPPLPSYPVSVYRLRIPADYDPEHPGRSGWRRGQYLPQDFRGEVVADYARYHLRKPPRGCVWYRDADDYVLASTTTGMIFEVIHAD